LNRRRLLVNANPMFFYDPEHACEPLRR